MGGSNGQKKVNMLAVGNFKICSSCKQQLPLNSFFKNRCTKDGYQNACNKCKAILNKNWKYSLNTGHYATLQAKQQFKCAICKTLEKDLLIDHNHKTGRLRSLLCRKCNTILGMCNDNIIILEEAIQYLKYWTEE